MKEFPVRGNSFVSWAAVLQAAAFFCLEMLWDINSDSCSRSTDTVHSSGTA